MADKREVLYQAISRDIEVMRDELMVEVRNSVAQVEALRNAVKSGNDEACDLITKEIRYGYKQNEHIYSGMENILNDGIDEKLSAIESKLSALEKMQAALDAMKAAQDEVSSKVDGVDKTLGDVNTRLADAYLPTEDQCQKMVDGVNNNVEVHNQRVLDAIAAIPQADEVDYTRIVEEVGDKVSALIDAIPQAKETEIDYDRIIDTTAEKVSENIPAAEQVDYARIEGDVINALEKALDMEAIAAAVAAKITIPQPAPVEVDYERLADMVAERLAAKEKTFEIVLDDEGITKIAEKVAEKLVIEDEETEESYDLVLDEEGIQAIAKGVAEELRDCCCKETQPVVIVAEEPAEVPAEEPAEEPVEEPIEEQPVEEVVESAAEQPVEEEMAVAIVPGFEEIGDGKYMDAETGLIIRLKKSFTAKMKQSDEKVKEYYSALKNELVSYKRINSNVSWHGDRFNFGRDTVAKMNICGKTLGLYLALDPTDEEFKTTVYHQKDVGKQKAYEHTPFMVKVKSDAAVKKAIRLVVALANKLETEKEEGFVATDYTKEYEYATTKQLYDEGHIKATKDKKVDLDF